MEFIADWQTINNPNALTLAAVVVAVTITAIMTVPVVKTAKKTAHVKPQSFLLLALPAMIIFGGVQLDDVRADRHQEQMTASGVTDTSWLEVEKMIRDNYNVGKVTPVGDTAETLNAVKAAASGSTNVSNVKEPKVAVQHPESTHTEIYRVIVTPAENGAPEITLARQQSLELAGEGVDPEAFRIN